MNFSLRRNAIDYEGVLLYCNHFTFNSTEIVCLLIYYSIYFERINIKKFMDLIGLEPMTGRL